MDSQSPQQSQLESEKVEVVAQQLLKAFNSESQSDSNIIIFLSKLYRNNSSLKNKKMKSIRLNQFINFLQYVVNDFPTAKEDTQLLYCSIVSTLTNDKNFSDDQDYELIQSIGFEIAKVIEKLCETPFTSLAMNLLSHVINSESLSSSIMEISVYEETLKISKYFQSISLDQSQNINHNAIHQHKWHILEQSPIQNIILDNISVQKVYACLFKSIEKKSKVVNLFYEHVKKLTRQLTSSRKDLFIESFITSQQKLTIPQVEALLRILQKEIFDRDAINEVVSKITQQKVSLQELIEINFKKIKGVQQVFVQCLLQQTSKRSINEMIELFLNMKSEENYFPLYLILKLNQKIPIQYLNLFFEDTHSFTMRRGVIFVLAIVDNQFNSFQKLIKQFLKWNASERVRTQKDYNLVLKAVHFSLQNVSKANLVSHILRFIHKKNLNKECDLEFIGYNGLKVSSQQEMKSFLNEETRGGLSALFKVLSEFEGMTKIQGSQGFSSEETKVHEWEHKYRMDLQFMLNSNLYLEQEISSSIKELNKLFQGNVNLQELLKQLPSLKENLLEVTLMWINNKYETFYQEQTNQQSVDWALKMYKKLTNDLNNQLKLLLQKEKLQTYFKLIKTLMEFTIERQQPIKFNPSQKNKIIHPQIIQLINSSIQKQQRMNSNNFNDYFLTQSKYKLYLTANNQNKLYAKIIWIKALLIETKSLIKNMIKAQKVGNRKQIKNIVAENVSDVLAFKIIHQYFDSELQQAPQMLIEVFRTIQPESQFFEKTQALASSLNIQFYSILEELPNLLENFNSDTLIFLSKLIFNPKPTGQDKRKTNKKKKDKENHPQDSVCLTFIIKNFQLLFGDPNQMESFKSLFVILRKLVDSQKINGSELQQNLNKWLAKINFISCSTFESWKNKVLSLSKMWKNAADLLGDKKIEKNFQLAVLQKHFNLFTDLLNKLYENFRQEPEFSQIQQRILLSLCLIYKKQDFSQVIEEQTSMVDFIIKTFQQRNISRIVLQNRFYFCHQCKKNACYACSSFLHRNHDKIYVGKTGICEHEANPAHKNKKQSLIKSQYTTSVFGGVSAILKKNQNLPEQVLERIQRKLLLEQQLRGEQDGEFIGRFRDPQIMRQILEGRIPRSKAQRSEEIKKRILEKENLLKNEINKNQEQQIQEDEKIMTPQAEEYFQYKEPFCKQFKKIHSEFKYQSPKMNKIIPKINTSPLARVFLRQLQENHFYNQEATDKQLENSSNQLVKVQEIKEKYQFFKNNNFKADNGRDYTFGRGRGGFGGELNYGHNPKDTLPSLRRVVVACNKKYLLLPSNMSLMNLSMSKIKERLDKKIQNKEFSQIDPEKNYVCSPPVNLPYEVLELAFSNSVSNPCVAVVGYNQLCFYPINADGRFGRQINPEFSRMDTIIKFSWINEKKNLFAVAFSNYIRIGGIGSSNNCKPVSKAQIGKTLRDFDGYMNSKTYILYILDTDGKLYYIDVDFKDGKNSAYNPQDKVISLKDEDGNIIKDQIYTIKSIDANRLLVSYPSGVIRIAQTSRQSNIWVTKKLDLKRVMKQDSLLVMQAMKIIKCDDQSVTFSALGRRLNAFENTRLRKCQGQLMIINFNTENQNLSSVFYTKEQNIESYDTTLISPGQLMVVILNDEGSVQTFRHAIDSENKQVVEKINLVMDNAAVRAFCKKLVGSEFFTRVQEGGMLRNLQFKENRNIGGSFIINTSKLLITIKQSNGYQNFVSGVSFQVQLPSSFTEYNVEDNNKQSQWVVSLKVRLLESSYVFRCSSKLRQIQLGLNIKESLQLFCHQNQMKVTYQVEYNKDVVDVSKLSAKELQEFVKIKNVQVYGYQARQMYTNNNNNSNSESNSYISPYHTAFRELFVSWHTYHQYNKQSFQQYLLNPYRHDFHNIDIKKLYKLKYDHLQSAPFKPNQVNLLLKLQLLSQTLSSDKHYTKQSLEEYIIAFKKQLLSKQYPRKSLQNSLYRLAYSLSDLYQSFVSLSPGHPYHAQTLINLHSVITTYQKWQLKKSLLTFDQLCTVLSNLIFTSAIDLHLILQTIPDLIIQLSSYFKQLITGRKQKHFSQDEAELSVTKTCSRFIGILCEYYQVMKNRSMPNIEENMLFLLQQVFGQSKSDMPKQLVMNPFLYLESIFTLNQQTQVKSVIDIYKIDTNTQQIKQESFYDIDRIQKNRKCKKLDQSDEIKQEEQRLLNQNRWEAIEEEKDMEEEEGQMYMQIEEEEFDEDEEMPADQVEQLDVQSRKQNSLKGQNSALQPQIPPVIQKDLQEKITKNILSHCLSQTKKILVNHYDFPFQLAIALFRKQNYLNQKNIYFYLGLLYNLLKIIENNLRITQNKNKILEFIQTVDSKISNSSYSSLFIVLNFFVSPKYHKTSHGFIIQKPQSSLSEHFVNYYKQKSSRFLELLTAYNPKECHPITKLAQIMRFSKFESRNQLYNMRFISNIYLTFRLMGNNFHQSEQNMRIKEELLFKLVKHKLPVLKNIMLFQKWEQQLDRAKVLVGFEMIFSSSNKSEDKQKGIEMLFECAHEKPQRFVEELLKDETKVMFLQEYSLQSAQLDQKTQTKVLQLLDIYYNS